MSGELSGNGLDTDATLREFASGQKLFNRYRLTKTLGRGGMGVVWLAHDEELERDVALKFLPELVIHDRAVLSDLKRETRRSLELTHKNIVRIYDFVHDNTSGCISMEYVDGDTLSNLRADKPKKVFDTNELADWIAELCDALHYAHNHALIVHRDIKPANLMVNRRRDLKVTDFGIARSLSDSVSKLTMQGKSGTLVYMSPQQLDGERGTPLDDIYSVGASVYELLTSKPPFYSGNIDRQVREKVPPPMMQRRTELEVEAEPIDAKWEQVVRTCLAKDPTRRPQSVSEIADRLELPLPGTRHSTRSRQSGRQQERKSGVSSSRKWLSLGLKVAASVVLVGLVAAAVAWFFMRQSLRPTTAAVASEQTPARVEASPTIEPKPSAAIAPASPMAAAAVPSPAPSATAEKASLELASVPTQAKVFYNGNFIGTTPMRRDNFTPGDTTVVLMKEGYLPRELKLALNSNAVLNKEISLAQAAPLYEGMIRVRDKNDAPAIPVSIALAPDSKSGTMTQITKDGNFVVKFAGDWEGAELHAATSDIISQPAGSQWTPQSFTLRFADDGKSGSYEYVADGSTYLAELTAQSGPKREVASVYKGAIRKQGDSTGRAVPLTITFAQDHNSGTETQGSKYGDTVVNFSGIWDGKTLRAATSTVVLKPKNIQWKPESFALSFADDWKTATYDCTAEGERFIADLSAQ